MGTTIDSFIRGRARRADMRSALNIEDIRWLRHMASGKQQETVPHEVLRKFIALKLAILERQGAIITSKGRLAVKLLG